MLTMVGRSARSGALAVRRGRNLMCGWALTADARSGDGNWLLPQLSTA